MIDKVTTGADNFVFIILSGAPIGACMAGGSLLFLAALVIISFKTQFADLVKGKDISQLINSMSNILQKLITYFHGT